MIVELISVGTELLMGNIVNTNVAYLASRCADLGAVCYFQTVVGDNPGRLKDTIKLALSRADVVLMTGGLGPTQDDLTKQTVAELFGRKLYRDEATCEALRAYFVKRGIACTENNFRQADIPESAEILVNNNGTAPGIHVFNESKHVFLMPGPPNEMKPMFEESVAPKLSALSGEVIYSEMVKVCGIPESTAETMIADILEGQSNPTIAPYAKLGEVHFRISAKAADVESAKALAEPVAEELIRRFGAAVYTTSEKEELEDAVVRLCKEHGYQITTAESCTGGLISARLVNVSGASDCFGRSFVTYANEAKMEELGVSEDTLKQFGAVSEETAREMALGAQRHAKADVAVAVTGIAGPTGGTPEKPVGLVYVACAVKERVWVKRYWFGGNRAKNRENTATVALAMARNCMLEYDGVTYHQEML
ncbi:MAG: competence/damage-inducible protein A [Lachnospiraceae bacterium]|nr:competence/damage-inducible protein A [Lachnospiraceae bacterium]